MSTRFPRSPYDTLYGLAYFPRMLDKIRIHESGQLPEVYHRHLGIDFDGRCLRLLGVTYAEVRVLVLAGKSDEEVFAWCQTHGKRITPEEIEVWSDFMRKRCWRDEYHDRLVFRVKEAGIEARASEISTMFDFIDVDEDRTPPDFKKWEKPPVSV